MSQEDKDMVMAITESCRKTHKVPDEEMNGCFEGKIPTSPNAKCAMACVLLEFGIVCKIMKSQFNTFHSMLISVSIFL